MSTANPHLRGSRDSRFNSGDVKLSKPGRVWLIGEVQLLPWALGLDVHRLITGRVLQPYTPTEEVTVISKWQDPVFESRVGLPGGGRGTLIALGYPNDKFSSRHSHWKVEPKGTGPNDIVEVCNRWLEHRYVQRWASECEHGRR